MSQTNFVTINIFPGQALLDLTKWTIEIVRTNIALLTIMANINLNKTTVCFSLAFYQELQMPSLYHSDPGLGGLSVVELETVQWSIP